MAKPLVFIKTKVKIDKYENELDSWDLISFGECPIMHAAWNPVQKVLICQFDSAKENIVTIPKQAANSGKVTFKESKAEQYYRVTIYDLDAVQFILDTYVANSVPSDWVMQDQLETADQVLQNAIS